MNFNGRPMKLKQAVSALTRKDSWRRAFRKGFYTNESFREVNDGLLQMNKLFNKYYNKTKDDILADKAFLRKFVNKNDENLGTKLKEAKQKATEYNVPKSYHDLLN